jgi:glycosyltransferase involved in cell wall biosynthesis
MPPITATIITLNEEDRIAAAIASLSCCDEVIVVDSGSTDRRQKNFAAGLARHDWILSLDADEQLSAELAAEIAEWKVREPRTSAISMPRRVYYLGGWIRHSGWYPDRKTRLYDRRFTFPIASGRTTSIGSIGTRAWRQPLLKKAAVAGMF